MTQRDDAPNYRQELVDALGELAWTLDAQGRKADSLTCTRAAIELAPVSETATLEDAARWCDEVAAANDPTRSGAAYCADLIRARALKNAAPQAEVRTVRPEEAARSPAAAAPNGNSE